MKYPIWSLALGLSLVSAVWATDSAPPLPAHASLSPDQQLFATVNGVPLSQQMYEFLRHSRAANDEEGDEHLDEALRDQQTARDLVMTELLSQQARTHGLHDTPVFKLEMEMAEKTLLAQLYVQRLLAEIVIDEARLKQAYEQQSPQVLYRFSIWRTRDVARANQMLAQLQAGGSVAPSPEEGLGMIETPWLRDVDIEPAVNSMASQLGVNDFAAEPILQDGVWKVVQLIDRKTLEKRSYAEEREIIKAELTRVELDKLLAELAQRSSIVIE